MFSSAKLILECVFGIHIGAAAGYITGKFAGLVYIRHVSPVPFSEAEMWWMVPFIYGIYGAVFGALLGLMTMAALNIRRRYIREAQSCEEATEETKKQGDQMD